MLDKAKLRAVGLCSFFLSFGLMSSASAQNPVPDFSLTLDGPFLATTIENSAESSMMKRPYIRWDSGTRVELNGNHVLINLLLDTAKAAKELKGELPAGTPDVVEIDVEFDLIVYCVAAIPEIGLTSSEAEVTIGVPWFLDLLIGPFQQVFIAAMDAIIQEAAEIPAQITTELRAKLREKIGQEEVPSCPYTTHASDGTITMDFGGPNSCVHGDTKKTGCGGPGGFAYWECVNGQWIPTDLTCH